MKLTIARIGKGKTVDFSCSELRRYLNLIDSSISIDERSYAQYHEDNKVLWIGIDGLVAASDEDEIKISVANGAGIITASNERALLIAVYRFLRELGCDWLFPGPDGEIIPKKKLSLDMIRAEVSEKASYRHRAICTEGAMGYEHLYNVIDWIPKAGMK